MRMHGEPGCQHHRRAPLARGSCAQLSERTAGSGSVPSRTPGNTRSAANGCGTLHLRRTRHASTKTVGHATPATASPDVHVSPRSSGCFARDGGGGCEQQAKVADGVAPTSQPQMSTSSSDGTGGTALT
jgi:hypothetical protein